MKYMKMLGLAAVAAAALMAFVGAGTASATVLCKTSTLTTGCAAAGQDYGANTTVEATLNGSAILEAGGFIEDTCTGSTIKGKTTNTGSSTETVSGNASSLTWSNCTFPTKTIKLGTLEIHYTSGDNGTLTASGFEVTIEQFFGSCVYKSGTANNLGTLKGGSPATIAISTTVTGSGFGCPSTATWNANYTVTNPNPLFISTN
jgi:hypothetical protein